MLPDFRMTERDMQEQVVAAWRWALEGGKHTSSGRVIALLIANRYNSRDFPTADIGSIRGTLDDERLRLAFSVIFWRHEPHLAINHAEDHLAALLSMYKIRRRRRG